LSILNRTGGRKIANRYQILCDKGCQSVTLSSEKGDTRGSERVTTEAEKGDTRVTRTINEPSVESSPPYPPPPNPGGESGSANAQTQHQDVIRWIEGECSRLGIRPGFRSTNAREKDKLRGADSAELRSQILRVLEPVTGMRRDMTSIVIGLVGNGRPRRAERSTAASQDTGGYRGGPQERKPDRKALALAAVDRWRPPEKTS
jgi:hypothetical protein